MNKKRAAWMIVRDDWWYVDMAIECVIDHVDGIFILDTGSTDKTMEVVTDLRHLYGGRLIVVEQKDFGVPRRFGPGWFDRWVEKDARNYSMFKALEIWKPNWLIQIDADEVYNDRYWEILETVEKTYLTFGHSTTMFSSSTRASDFSADKRGMGGKMLFDPHIRSWSAKLPIEWVQPPHAHAHLSVKMGDKYIGLPEDFVTEDHVHFHLHRSFGPKSLHTFFTTGLGWDGAAEKLGIPIEKIFDQDQYEKKFPQNFTDGKFCPPKEAVENKLAYSIPLTHPLPKYTLKRWKDWGIW